jgi:hypothetical protein
MWIYANCRLPAGFGVCLAALSLFAGGCSLSPASVSGVVTYDGKPVESGEITFTPADGKGPTAGGKIEAGKYSVADVHPGSKIVQVTSLGGIQFAASTEELARQAAAAGNRPVEPPPVEELVPSNAVGNGQRVQIKPGSQTLDLQLTPPASS